MIFVIQIITQITYILRPENKITNTTELVFNEGESKFNEQICPHMEISHSLSCPQVKISSLSVNNAKNLQACMFADVKQ